MYILLVLLLLFTTMLKKILNIIHLIEDMIHYWKTEDDRYHWDKSCHLLPDNVEVNSEWVVSNIKPVSKKQCKYCKNYDYMPE